MWLLFCAATDAPGLWAYECLRARGLQLELVASDVLVGARWDYRLGAEGVSVDIGLEDGRTIRSRDVRGVLNRLLFVPPESTRYFEESDREYAAQEFNAFYLGWLGAMPGPVLNRPTPQGLCGRVRHISEWVWLAYQAGLATPVYTQSSRSAVMPYSLHTRVGAGNGDFRTVLVVDQHVIGATAPAQVIDGCRRMAALAKTPLLGVEFAVDAEQAWVFAGVTTMPDLRLGGADLVDALMAVFDSGAEVGLV